MWIGFVENIILAYWLLIKKVKEERSEHCGDHSIHHSYIGWFKTLSNV